MKKNLLNLKTMVIALAILFSGAAHAFTAVTSGNWSSGATWGGVAPGSMVSASDIIIPAGITVTLDTDVNFSGLSINTFSVGGTLSSTTNNKLVLTSGIFTGNGVVSIRKIMFSGLSAALYNGVLTVKEMVNSMSSLAFLATANVSDSLVLETGSLTLNSSSNLSLASGNTIRIKDGVLVPGAGLFTAINNYNVFYVGGTKSSGMELSGAGLQNITVKLSSNTDKVTLNSDASINNLTITRGGLNFTNRTLTFKGDFVAGAGAGLLSSPTSDLIVEGTTAMTNPIVFQSSTSFLHTLVINRNPSAKLGSALNISNSLKLVNGNLSIESGGTLVMTGGSGIHVEAGTMTLNSGVFSGTANYFVEYLGTTNASSGIELTAPGLEGIIVNYSAPTSKVTLNNDVTVTNALYMTNGSIDLNGRNLTSIGDFTQSATSSFIGNAASELSFSLTTAASSTLNFDNTNNTISKLKLYIGGTSPLVLGTALNIKNELMLGTGKLMLDNADLTIQSTANITGYDDSKYIVTTGTGSGRLKMNVIAGSGYVTFPVGTTINYSPAYVQQNASGTTGNITVKAMNDVLTNGYTGFPLGTVPAVSRTWYVEAESGVTVDLNLKLGWMVASEVNGFNRTNAMLRHYTGGTWDTYTSASASAGANSTFELTRTGITSLSPFAVSETNSALKVAEQTNALEFKMFPNPAKDMIVVKVPSTSDVYKYDVIDITGRLVSTTEKSAGSVNINISDLHQGVYFVKTTNLTNNTSGVKRFIKE